MMCLATGQVCPDERYASEMVVRPTTVLYSANYIIPTGLTPTKAAPKYYHTKPVVAVASTSSTTITNSPGVRYSKRLRRDDPELEVSLR